MTADRKRDLPPFGSEPASLRVQVLLFAVMAVAVSVDVITDFGDRATVAHILLELAVVAIGFSAAGSIALRLRRSAGDAQVLREQAAQLTEALRLTRQEAAQWRSDAADLITGLSAAIDAQLARWELSPASRRPQVLGPPRVSPTVRMWDGGSPRR